MLATIPVRVFGTSRYLYIAQEVNREIKYMSKHSSLKNKIVFRSI